MPGAHSTSDDEDEYVFIDDFSPIYKNNGEFKTADRLTLYNLNSMDPMQLDWSIKAKGLSLVGFDEIYSENLLIDDEGLSISLPSSDLTNRTDFSFDGTSHIKGPVTIQNFDHVQINGKLITKSVFRTAADIHVNESGGLIISKFEATQRKDNDIHRIQNLINEGDIVISTLDQGNNERLLNINNTRNTSTLLVKSGGGYLRLIDNLGSVNSGISVRSSFSDTFFDTHEQTTGSIASKNMILVDLKNIANKNITWGQNLDASFIIMANLKDVKNPSSDLLKAITPPIHLNFAAGVSLNAENKNKDDKNSGFLVVKAKNITTQPTSLLASDVNILLSTGWREHEFHDDSVILAGSVKSKQLSLDTKNITGQGYLDIVDLSIKAEAAHINAFVFGPEVKNVLVRTNKFELNRPQFEGSHILKLKGDIDIAANDIQIKTPVRAAGKATFLGNKKLNISASIKADDELFLKSQEIGFAPKEKHQLLQGKNVSLHKDENLNTNASFFEIPRNVTLKAAHKTLTGEEKLGTLSVEVPKKSLVLYDNHKGRKLYLNAGSTTLYTKEINPQRKIYGFNGFSRVSVGGNQLVMNAPIRADNFKVLVDSMLVNRDIDTDEFDLTATQKIKIGSTRLDSNEPSTITSNRCILTNTKITSPQLTTKGGDFVYDGVDARDTTIIQKNKISVALNDNRFGNYQVKGTLTTADNSNTSFEYLSSGKNTEVVDFRGNVTTEQAILSLKAKKEIFIKNLKRTGYSDTFDIFEASADQVEIQGGLQAKIANIEAREELRLKQAKLMAHIFYLLSHEKLDIEKTDIDVDTLAVQAGDISIQDSTLKGQDQSLFATKDLKTRNVAQVISGKASYGASNVTLDGHIKADVLTVEANRALVYKTPSGKTFEEKVISTKGNDCAFYCFELNREQGINLLLQHASDSRIRTLMASEILESTLQGKLNKLADKAKTYYDEYCAIEAKLTTGRLLAMEADEAKRKVKNNVLEWAKSESVFKTYVGEYLAGPEAMLGYVNDSQSNTPISGSMDALSQILGVHLTVYVRSNGDSKTLRLVHEFNQHGKKSISVLHTSTEGANPENPNHFNLLLEPDAHRVKEGKANLRDVSIEAKKNVDIKAERADLTPKFIKANLANIHLKHYDNGIEGVIKLAHDLVNCKSVHLDARDHTLLIEKDTTWRPNVSLVLKRAEISQPLRSPGDLAFETQEGAKVTGTIHANTLDIHANHGDIEFYNTVLDAIENISLIAEAGNVRGKGSDVHAGNNFKAKASGDVALEAYTTRYGSGENYHDIVTPFKIAADRGEIDISAGLDIHFTGLKTRSGGDTKIAAGRHFFDQALAKEWQTVRRDADSMTRMREITHERPEHIAGGRVNITAGGAAVLSAPDMTAKKITISADWGVHIEDVHNIFEYEHHETRKKRNWYGGSTSKTIHETRTNVTSIAGVLTSAEPIEINSGQDINLTHVIFRAPKTVLRAMNGMVRLLQGQNISASSRTMSWKNVAWQRNKVDQEYHKTYSACEFLGALEIHSKETLLQQVEGKTLEFANRIDQNGGKVTYEFLKEVHESIHKSQAGPTAALSAVVAIAIAIATYGAGSYLGGLAAASAGSATVGSVAGTTALTGASAAGAASALGVAAGTTITLSTTGAIISGMTQAAFMTLCSQAGLSLLNAEGDIGKAAKSLASGYTLKAIAISMASAGLTQGIGANLPMNMDTSSFSSIGQHAAYQGLQAGVGLTLDALTGENLGEAFENRLKFAAVNTLAGYAANKIGNAVKLGDIDKATQKFLHAVVGASGGAALSRNAGQGAIAGAMGAFIAEVMTDILNPAEEIKEKVKKLEAEKGGILTSAEYASIEGVVKRSTYDWSRLTAATTVMLAGLDVNMADHMATNALDNNFLVLLYWGGLAVRVGYAAYEFIYVLNHEGIVPALKGLGITVTEEIILWALGIGVIKTGGKILGTGAIIYDKLLGKTPIGIALKGSKEKIIKALDEVVENLYKQKIAKSSVGAILSKAEKINIDLYKKLGWTKYNPKTHKNYEYGFLDGLSGLNQKTRQHLNKYYKIYEIKHPREIMSVNTKLRSAERIGSALEKTDKHHYLSSFFADDSTSILRLISRNHSGQFTECFYRKATIEGKSGIVEFFLNRAGQVKHQQFKTGISVDTFLKNVGW